VHICQCLQKIIDWVLLTWLRSCSDVRHPDPERRADVAANYNLSLRLGSMPRINEEEYIGRNVELEQLQKWLNPHPKCQNLVALYGLGRMGKT
jgi:hypothetical protein